MLQQYHEVIAVLFTAVSMLSTRHVVVSTTGKVVRGAGLWSDPGRGDGECWQAR